MIIEQETERGKIMNNDETKKRGVSKGLIAFIVAILVVGGSVAAYLIISSSTKVKYFAAEKESFEFMTEKLQDRYQPELDWYEQSAKNPTETALQLSGEYNDPNAAGIGMGPEQFINNSTLTITTAVDMEKEQIAAKLKANVGEIEIDDVNFYLTSEKILVGLPFIAELLQVKNDDLASMLHNINPELFTGEEDLDPSAIFDSSGGLSEEDIKHFKKEYFKMIYDELPEDAFDSTNETITVNDKSVDTEKMVLHLSEKQVKDLVTKVLNKMEKDKTLKELIKEQSALQQMGGTAINAETDQLISEFESGIAEVKDAMKDFKIPDGLTAALWINDGLVVQRDFKIEMGPSEQELVTISVKGTQLLEDDNQFFNYDLGFSDESDEGTINVSGNLTWKDDKAKDSIKLTAEDTVFSYEGTESLKDGKRNFERLFSYKDPLGDGGSLSWDGHASYEKDQMNAEHNLSVISPEMDQNMFSLQLAIDGKTIKNVEIPSEDGVKDLGSMSQEEITQYFQGDVAPDFQKWLMETIGIGGLGL